MRANFIFSPDLVRAYPDLCGNGVALPEQDVGIPNAPKEHDMPALDLPQPTQPLADMHLLTDTLHAVALALAIGLGTALGAGALVLMLASIAP